MTDQQTKKEQSKAMPGHRTPKKRITAAVAVLLLFTGHLVAAQEQLDDQSPTPQAYQPGKDVVWLPTEKELVRKMLDMAKITPDDYVIDLGSGDGRMVIAAAERGARALGIEYNQDLVKLSKRLAEDAGVSDRAKFVKADLFECDLSQATVITMFLLREINLKLRPRILRLKPGTRILSNTFDMGEWKPDQTVQIDDPDHYGVGYFWIVPARVEGIWSTPQGQLMLRQSFQVVSGKITTGSVGTRIASCRMRGDQLGFRVGDTQYAGRVIGDTIEGTIAVGGRRSKWTASRIRLPSRALSLREP